MKRTLISMLAMIVMVVISPVAYADASIDVQGVLQPITETPTQSSTSTEKAIVTSVTPRQPIPKLGELTNYYWVIAIYLFVVIYLIYKIQKLE